ncbi:MAG: YfcC family protein, partial [Flavobacteriaceae bacterium]
MALFRKFKFPTAHTILFIIAAFVALLTWLIPSGQYDRLSYDTENDVFIRVSKDESTTIAAKQEELSALNIKIPLQKFKDGAISKPISIPGSYTSLKGQPQGLWAFIQAPIKGIIQASDIILLVLIIGGLVAI